MGLGALEPSWAAAAMTCGPLSPRSIQPAGEGEIAPLLLGVLRRDPGFGIHPLMGRQTGSSHPHSHRSVIGFQVSTVHPGRWRVGTTRFCQGKGLPVMTRRPARRAAWSRR